MFRRIPVPQTPRESESCDVCFPVLPSRGLTFTQAVGVTSPRSHCPSVSVSPCSRLPPLWTGNRAPAFSWDGGCVGGVRARARRIGLRLFLLDIYIFVQQHRWEHYRYYIVDRNLQGHPTSGRFLSWQGKGVSHLVVS